MILVSKLIIVFPKMFRQIVVEYRYRPERILYSMFNGVCLATSCWYDGLIKCFKTSHMQSDKLDEILQATFKAATAEQLNINNSAWFSISFDLGQLTWSTWNWKSKKVIEEECFNIMLDSSNIQVISVKTFAVFTF